VQAGYIPVHGFHQPGQADNGVEGKSADAAHTGAGFLRAGVH
jgi:hypothetical protein